MAPSVTICEIFGTRPKCPPITRRTSPSLASRFRPLSRPSPGAAANTSVRSRGALVSTNRASSAAITASGVPTPTKPEVATVSPGRMMATASSTGTTLLP